MEKDEMKFPESRYAIRESKPDKGYSIMVVDTSLKDYKFKDEFPWYLLISIQMENVHEQFNLPTDEEAKVLNQLEDSLLLQIREKCQAHFVGRITSNGIRNLYCYLDHPEKANKILQALTAESRPLRELEYSMKKDPEWNEVRFFFSYANE